MSAIDNRPKLNYPGDVRGSVGAVVGPTLHGEFLTVAEVEYDEQAAQSTARFRYTTQKDIDRLAGSAPAAFVRDHIGFARQQVIAGGAS